MAVHTGAQPNIEQAKSEQIRDIGGRSKGRPAERAHSLQQIRLRRARPQPNPARVAAEMTRGAHAAPARRRERRGPRKLPASRSRARPPPDSRAGAAFTPRPERTSQWWPPPPCEIETCHRRRGSDGSRVGIPKAARALESEVRFDVLAVAMANRLSTRLKVVVAPGKREGHTAH